MSSADDRRIRSLRPPKPDVDPWRPHDVLVEKERRPEGVVVDAATVFLSGAECPFTCVFCDLWRFTLDEPTPAGAIPAQLREAWRRLGPRLEELSTAKLYNASNFFDPRAVPPSDDAEIARLLEPFEHVVVECHPRLVGRRALDFAERLDGRLQVGLGLESAHPEAQARLNKSATLDDFERAAATLRRHDLGVRAFVLVGTPFVPPDEALEWTRRSAAWALERGAEHVSLIPVRTGNGEMERLEREGHFRSPTLADVEHAYQRCLALGGVVTVDLWDLDRFAACRSCRADRVARLERVNLSGRWESARSTRHCGACGEKMPSPC